MSGCMLVWLMTLAHVSNVTVNLCRSHCMLSICTYFFRPPLVFQTTEPSGGSSLSAPTYPPTVSTKRRIRSAQPLDTYSSRLMALVTWNGEKDAFMEFVASQFLSLGPESLNSMLSTRHMELPAIYFCTDQWKYQTVQHSY